MAMADYQQLQTAPPQYLFLLALAILGLVRIVRSAYSFISWLWITFLRPGKNLRRRYGTWALVTGCTDGIGRAFCFHLARKRLNLVLVGRNESKLQQLENELRSKYQVEVRYVDVNFTLPDLDAGLSRLEEIVGSLEVGLLVSNAGQSYPYARFFHEVDGELTKSLIRTNVEVITRMVQIVLPGMLRRKRGAIVNIGSGAATVLPSDPLYSLYAGTKAFVDQFSRSLYVEYKHIGIDVQCQVPLYVATKLASIKKSSFFVPSPDTFARCAIRWIGYEPRCTPYWPHSILWWLVSFLPESLVDSFRLRFCLNIRKRGQSKEFRKKE
eukprot:c17867_g1_i1 orf=282-1256(+)